MSQNNKIEIIPLSGSLGAEIYNIDLTLITSKNFIEIYKAFNEHQVIFFHNQNMNPEIFLNFAKKWGEMHHHPFMKSLENYPDILEILKTEDDSKAFGNVWHTDQMFTEVPAKCTILYSLEMPEVGGDTLFTNLYEAYNKLSSGLKHMLENINALNIGDKQPSIGGQSRKDRHDGTMSNMQVKDPGKVKTESMHPVIRTHPDTKKKALFIGGHTSQFENMTLEESQPLLNYLKKHITRPEFTCRFRWKVGSVAIWDNRCTLHYAIDDYSGYRRKMHRITIKGEEKPY